MRINFFFDIDGTILPFGKDIPQSALKAFEKAHEEGHRLFFATGRGTAEIQESLKRLNFDGGVFSAGGTLLFGNKVIYERRCSKEEKAYILDYAEKYKLRLLVQTEKGTYVHPDAYKLWKESLLKYIGREIAIPQLLIVDSFPDDMVVNKLVIFSPENNVESVKANIDKHFTVVGNTIGLPQTFMAEVVLSDITKATGIERMISYLGDSYDSIVAIGDGPNDIEMIEYASIGIAMGNGCEELKQKADFITTDIENDGIKNALFYAINKKEKDL